MFGPRLRQAQRIARRRYVRQVWPYLTTGFWRVEFPPDFDPYRRNVMPGVMRWTSRPVGMYRKFNGAHGRWCCTRPHLKEKGWRKVRSRLLWFERRELEAEVPA